MSSSSSFKEYQIKIRDIKQNKLTNEWGWFVDLENSEHNPYMQICNIRQRDYINKQLLKTTKSTKNLQSNDTSMIFEMEMENKDISTKAFIGNIIGFCIIMGCFCITFLVK
jgi:hypothetical protein